MLKNHYSFKGKLVRIPFPNNIILSIPSIMKLVTFNDFEVASGIKRTNKIQILISFYEHYELLKIIIEEFWNKIQGIGTILVNLHYPTWAIFNPVLLHEDVFICFGIQDEKKYFINRETPLLTIEDSFVRLPQECGDNGISINLYTNDDNEDDFNNVIKFLGQFGIEKSI